MQRVPSHMRDLHSFLLRNLQNLAFEYSEALHPRRLVAPFKEKLQPEADSEKWRSLICHLTDHVLQTSFPYRRHGVAKCAYSRQDHFVRRKYRLLIPGHFNLLSEEEQSFFHTLYIACIIINDRYHPFLLRF